MSTGTDRDLARALKSAVELNSGMADIPFKVDLKRKQLAVQPVQLLYATMSMNTANVKI